MAQGHLFSIELLTIPVAVELSQCIGVGGWEWTISCSVVRIGIPFSSLCILAWRCWLSCCYNSNIEWYHNSIFLPNQLITCNDVVGHWWGVQRVHTLHILCQNCPPQEWMGRVCLYETRDLVYVFIQIIQRVQGVVLRGHVLSFPLVAGRTCLCIFQSRCGPSLFFHTSW